MKNIHLIPTDKPSKLWKFNNEFYYVIDGIYGIFNSNKEKYNLYITSDEEIKEGDWYCSPNGIISKHNGTEILPDNWKKIILTTDQDLINDGVQAIDDEFLEWFVKNPSCEFIQTERLEDGQYFDYLEDNSVIEGIYENYKIIIPQEEFKQDSNFYKKLKFSFSEKLKQYFEETPREKILEDWAKSVEYDNVGPTVDDFLNNTKEQETLEEAARKNALIELEKYQPNKERFKLSCKNSFLRGAKLQQEQMYSEEEMISFMQFIISQETLDNTSSVSKETAKYYLEQFKKK
jgi:hypothetical protein